MKSKLYFYGFLVLMVTGNSRGMIPKDNVTIDTMSTCTCVFPFIYKKWLHTTCTQLENMPAPWCATAVDSTGKLTSWNYCQNSCPGVLPPPPMFVNPENQIGKCSCGVPNTKPLSRIVGGEETQIGEYPWQVSLLSGSNDTDDHNCGGSLVGDKYVITAAHCTDGKSASSLWVSIGDNNLGITNEIKSFTIGVKTIKQHPSYDPRNFFANDIAVLELEQAVDLINYPNIKPICLPAQDADYTGEVATNTGWGRLNTGFPLPSKLHEVNLEVYADNDCGEWSTLSPGKVCAGVRGGGQGSCNGDSGGPLVVRDPDNNGAMTLVGVVSYGSSRGCALGDWYTVYAEASYYRSWINNQLSNLNTCSPPGKGSPTTTTTTSTTTTTTTKTECWKEDMMLSKLVNYRTIKRVSSAQSCYELCKKDDECEYFQFKNPRNKPKATCELKKISYKNKNGFFSGDNNC